MSNEAIKKQVNILKGQSERPSALLETVKDAFAQTLKQFSLPVDIALKNPHMFDSVVVHFGLETTAENKEELQAAASMEAMRALRPHLANTADTVSLAEAGEYFEAELEKRLQKAMN